MPSQAIELIESNTAHIEHNALSALSSLLHHERCPLYTCGRYYLENLILWTRRHDYESPKKKARPFHDIDVRSSPLKNPRVKSSSNAKATSRDKIHIPLLPSTHPLTLLKWRAHVVEWMFALADSTGMQRNIAVASMAYLDVYSMYCVFPEEFQKRILNASTDAFSFDDRLGKISGHLYCLAATACFHAASKFYNAESNIYSLKEACQNTNFTEREIEDMELAVLKTLHFRMNPCTPARFLGEMTVLLLDHNETVCDSEFCDEEGEIVPRKRNSCRLGTFLATTWCPKSKIEATIVEQAAYLSDLVAYSSEYPHVIRALPSKIALAAILEPATENIEGEEQLYFQDRLDELSFRSPAFKYNIEIEDIRRCIREMLHRNGEPEELKKLEGASPVTSLDFEQPSLAKEDKFLSSEAGSFIEKFGPIKNDDTLLDASHDSIDFKVNNKNVVSTETNIENHDLLIESRVWESLEEPRPLDINNRPSLTPYIDISCDDTTLKTNRRVSNIAF